MRNIIYLFTFILFLGLSSKVIAQQTNSDSTFTYQVKQGENLYRVSLKFKCSIQQIKEWNNLSNEDYIQAGQKLRIKVEPIELVIPPSNKLLLTKRKNDSIDLKIKNFLDSIKKANNIVPIDSIFPKSLLKKQPPDEYKNLDFAGTRMIDKEEKYDSTSQLKISGYVSTYYAIYSDSVGLGNYQKFPTSAPLSNAFSLNMALISAKYSSTKFRGTVTLHYGDIPLSAWSSKYNLIQEANAGFKIFKGLWLDAGFFRTHIGVESIQPRENITISVSTVTYYEPYYLSGAKLSYQLSNKISVQLNVFNGFNTFVETNKNKTIGLSAIYDFSEKLSFNLNTVYTDESADDQLRKQNRLYNNFYFTYKSKKIELAAEMNFGMQENSKLNDTSKTAYMYSGLLVAKYKFNKKLSLYLRGEYFTDQNEILTGPVLNDYHKLVGIHLFGLTGGFEIKPIANSYLRFEWRKIETLDSDEAIFIYNQQYSHVRDEFLTSLGFWF